jgi:LAS superfamily LD-carboxypeptidase LdcB
MHPFMKYALPVLLFLLAVSCMETAQTQPGPAVALASVDSLPAPRPVAVAQPDTSGPPRRHLEFSIEYLTGKFDPASHPDFVKVDPRYADGEGYYLRRDTYESFRKMWEAAKAAGIQLTIISATRNFERQKQIWEAKWTGGRPIENGANAARKYPNPKTRALKILEYSSMPGTSRHHWGTDIDLNDLDNYTFEQGKGKEVYDWLQQHAAEYGFCQPYSVKGEERPHGYNEEKWHWSYMPVSRQLTELASRRFRDQMISGFAGAETAIEIGVVEKYVLGINQACK